MNWGGRMRNISIPIRCYYLRLGEDKEKGGTSSDNFNMVMGSL